MPARWMAALMATLPSAGAGTSASVPHEAADGRARTAGQVGSVVHDALLD